MTAVTNDDVERASGSEVHPYKAFVACGRTYALRYDDDYVYLDRRAHLYGAIVATVAFPRAMAGVIGEALAQLPD